MWYRVFGINEAQARPDAILSDLHAQWSGLIGDFHGDDGGWVQATISFADTTPIHLERFLSSEEGIRAELNNWAAYLETCDYSPNHARLMEHMIQTKQLFTIRRPIDAANEVTVEGICLWVARYLARTTEGIYQIDQQGFFSPDGVLLLEEF